jgi:hypothetical protein
MAERLAAASVHAKDNVRLSAELKRIRRDGSRLLSPFSFPPTFTVFLILFFFF